jgi:hypothetical protein|tara:strand:- start:545 stop:724 length:180 start_codon:yes stop_codon:yes gene_type:complete
MQIIGVCMTERLERGMHKQKIGNLAKFEFGYCFLVPKKQSYKISRKKNLGDNEKAFEQT